MYRRLHAAFAVVTVATLLILACSPTSAGGPEAKETAPAPSLTEVAPSQVLEMLTQIPDPGTGDDIPDNIPTPRVIVSNALPTESPTAPPPEENPIPIVEQMPRSASDLDWGFYLGDKRTALQITDELEALTAYTYTDSSGTQVETTGRQEVHKAVLIKMGGQGLLGDFGKSWDQVTIEDLQVAFDNAGYSWRDSLFEGMWSSNPVSKNGEMGVYTDNTGNPFNAGLPVGQEFGDWQVEFQTMPSGANKQMMVKNTQANLMTNVAFGENGPVSFMDLDTRNWIAIDPLIGKLIVDGGYWDGVNQLWVDQDGKQYKQGADGKLELLEPELPLNEVGTKTFDLSDGTTWSVPELPVNSNEPARAANNQAAESALAYIVGQANVRYGTHLQPGLYTPSIARTEYFYGLNYGDKTVDSVYLGGREVKLSDGRTVHVMIYKYPDGALWTYPVVNDDGQDDYYPLFVDGVAQFQYEYITEDGYEFKIPE